MKKKGTVKRVAVLGFDKELMEGELKKHGFVIEKLNPEAVVAFGGDGAALASEILYPGVPRLSIMHSRVCKKCTVGKGHDFSKVLEKLKNRRYKIVKEHKVEGIVNGDKRKTLVGLNEINVAHALPTKAIRFDVDVDGRSAGKGLIGDGVLVATPYGSTAYFYTITGRKFSDRLGIAFNNVNKKPKYKLVKLDSTIKVNINRGPGFMVADNNTTMIPLNDGDTVTIKLAKQKASIIHLRGEKRKISA